MILYRHHDTTTFTSVKPAHIGSVAYSLPVIPLTPVLKLKLTPETWREWGCPDRLRVVADVGDDPDPPALVAEGGWCQPSPTTDSRDTPT
jgi:hypothetical protein